MSDNHETMLGLPPGITVVTRGSDPGPLHSGASGNDHAPNYVLHRPDGLAIFKYTGLAAPEYFNFDDSPVYYYTGGEVDLDQFQGSAWPHSNVPVLPASFRVNGTRYDCTGTSIGGSPSDFWDVSWYAGPNGASGSIRFGFSQGQYWNTAAFVSPQGSYLGQVDPSTLACTGFGDSFSITFLPPSSPPLYGPAGVTIIGQNLAYGGLDQAGRDIYFPPAGDFALSIDSTGYCRLSYHLRWGGEISGQYDPSASVFDFGLSNPICCVALDANGAPLGLPPGLALYFGADGYAQTLTLGDGTTRTADGPAACRFHRNSTSTWGVKFLGLPDGTLFMVSDLSDHSGAASPIYRYSAGLADDVINASTIGWPDSNLFPDQLYVNGYLALPVLGSAWTSGAGTTRTGGLDYRIQSTQETVTVAYQWSGAFSASVSGTYDHFGAFQGGTWDGGKLFGALPAGLAITLDPLRNNPRLGPPRIEWDGIEFTFDPIASAVSSSNPSGHDVYRDALGLSLSIAIAGNGSGGGLVTLTRADGAQETGAYDPVTGKFTASGAGAGALTAVDGHGNPYDPSGTNAAAGGTLGAPSETTNILGNLDIHGSSLTLGTWTDSQNNPTNGFGLNFSNASGDQHAALDFSAVRPGTDWTWSHPTEGGGSQHATAMRVDASHRLILYDPATPGTPSIILDPHGQSHLEPQGDLSKGQFTATPQ